MIKEYLKGHHGDNLELQEDYLDWYSLSYFGDIKLWRGLTEDKLIAFMTLENEKEQKYWDNWCKIYEKVYGGK